jgi:hypothetical protein
MKSNFTFYAGKTEYAKAIFVIILFLSSLFLYSCTTSAQENLGKKSEIDNKNEEEKEFTFHQDKNGKDIMWKAIFKDGELTELYKNGQKIPNENIEDYTNMVNEELDGLQDNHHKFGKNAYHFNFDIDGPDNAGEFLGDMGFNNCDSLFDSGQFHKDMDDLKHDMHKMHKMKFDFHFDTNAFNMGMRELRKNLKNLKFNPHIYIDKDEFHGFDMEAFKEGMKNFKDEMRHNRIFNEDFKIDMSDFENNMKNFDKNMKHFDLHMKDLSKSLKKLKNFLKDLKHELVNDKLIKDEDENFNMKFNQNALIINGNKVSGELLEKYKAIYKKDFGKDIDDEFNINNNGDDDPDLNDN